MSWNIGTCYSFWYLIVLDWYQNTLSFGKSKCHLPKNYSAPFFCNAAGVVYLDAKSQQHICSYWWLVLIYLNPKQLTKTRWKKTRSHRSHPSGFFPSLPVGMCQDHQEEWGPLARLIDEDARCPQSRYDNASTTNVLPLTSCLICCQAPLQAAIWGCMRLAKERRLDNQLWQGRAGKQQQTTRAGRKTRTSNESGWRTMMTSNESGWRTAAWRRRAAAWQERVARREQVVQRERAADIMALN